MGLLTKAVTLFLTVSAAARPTASIPWSRIPAGIFLGGACFAIFTTAAGFLLAAISLASLDETFGRDLDFTEPD